MPTLHQRPGRTAPLPVVLALAGAVLAGCTGGPPVAPPTAPLAPSPAAGPSDAALCGPKVFGAEQPEDAWVRFDVTRAQLEVIERRLRQGPVPRGAVAQGGGLRGQLRPGTGHLVRARPPRASRGSAPARSSTASSAPRRLLSK